MTVKPRAGKSLAKHLHELWTQRQLIVLSLPIVFVLVFSYLPLWGWVIAFQNYKPALGPMRSQWVGLKNFVDMFNDPIFWNALKNSMGIGVLKIFCSYFFTLLLAILLNEIRVTWFKRTVQTISYLPHFVSWVVASNLIFVVLAPDSGIINVLLKSMGLIKDGIPFMGRPDLFWVIIALSEVWKSAGYGAIIYLSSMTAIDPELYESADIDGAGRIRKIWSITLPSISPTIKILLVLSIGRLFSVGFEQVYLMRTAMTMSTGTTLEVWVYEFAMRYAQFSKGAAFSIANSIVSLMLIVAANLVVKRMDGESIL